MFKVSFYQRLCAVAFLFSALTSFAADDYSAGWGPQLGATMPVLEASDQSGTARSLSNLAGEQGLLLFMSRSADW